ncbi:hypothetical protein HHI36_015053 [Cryptolaemus montrouzieri]|uniref:General transcription factor 3C polypeptide 3 n=1 Tax=Cryptolaemus montrouzieri TaxID=559131 RepID=A0ABD2N4G5_9CUCU
MESDDEILTLEVPNFSFENMLGDYPSASTAPTNSQEWEESLIEHESDFEDSYDEDEFNIETIATPFTLQEKKEEKKDKGNVKIMTKLTAEYKGLMGEANLRFAKGDIETAQKMCFEIIRQVPDAWEPYLTLAQIHESANPSKCKGYLTIASYLNPSNSNTWCRLAEICVEEGNKKEAIRTYSKCLNYDKMNIEVHRKRLKLAEELGEKHLLITFKESLISKLTENDFEEIIETASHVTKSYYKDKKYSKALNVLQIPFRLIPQHVTPDLVNILLELLLLTNQYSQCLDIFVDFCNFNFEIVVQSDESIKINDYSMPDNISIDLKTKFIVCAVKLKCFDVAEKLIDAIIIEEDVEIVGDLFLDICEALMMEKQFQIALKLFVPLKKSKNFSLAGVWLKFSECLEECGLKEQAVEGYFTVITLAPQHLEVLYPLAKLLLEMNKKKEALEVMSYQTADRLNVGVLMLRLKILKQIGDLQEYWKCMELLLSRHCVVFRHESEMNMAVTVGRCSEKVARIQKLREFRNDDTEPIPNQNATCIMEPEVEKEYELLKDVLQFALQTKEFEQMQKLSMMAYTSKRFERYSDEIAFFMLLACLHNEDIYHGYHIVRDIAGKYHQNNFIWNIFNLFMTAGNQKVSKFIMRLRRKVPEIEALEVLDANMDFCSANYTSALKYFIKEFKTTNSPYVSFILGIITLHLSTIMKQVTEDVKTQLSETTTYLFLYYAKSRSKMASQEVFYNLGRMYQQLGIMYLAEHYYKKVFEVENELLEEHPDTLCLRAEAAYNLHLIYKASGNLIAARAILMKHVVI